MKFCSTKIAYADRKLVMDEDEEDEEFEMATVQNPMARNQVNKLKKLAAENAELARMQHENAAMSQEIARRMRNLKPRSAQGNRLGKRKKKKRLKKNELEQTVSDTASREIELLTLSGRRGASDESTSNVAQAEVVKLSVE